MQQPPEGASLLATFNALNLEAMTKVIALFTAVALGTGFLYDSVFFLWVYPPISQLMTLSDHIETAVSAVPFILVFTLILTTTFNSRINRLSRRTKLAVLGALVSVLALALYFAGDIVKAQYGGGFFLMQAIYIVAFSAVIALFRVFQRAQPDGASLLEFPRHQFGLIVGSLWILATFMFASINGLAASSSRNFEEKWGSQPTRFTLIDGGVLQGRIVRLLDKGVVMLSQPGNRIEFIPKDQLRRFEVTPATKWYPQSSQPNVEPNSIVGLKA